jgi:hypothetical protein
MLSFNEQVVVFDHIRNGIDTELRNTGFEEFLSEHAINPTLGRLVVVRTSIYNTRLTTLDIDSDPLALRLATQYEVGISTENGKARSYVGIPVSEAFDGQAHEQAGLGQELDYIQYISVLSSISKLRNARTKGLLPFLTKSLVKIDPAGD